MRGLLILLLAAAFVPAASSASPLASGLPSSFVLVRTGPAGGTVWEGRILDRQVNDPRLSDVYLPPDFSPALRYPVVIFLHGFWGSPSSFVHGLHLAEAADQEIAAGRARPFIGVMPPGGPMTKTTSDEWAGVWENYVIRDVVPWVEGHFLTVPSRSAIAGLSAGGYGAVDMGLRHPTMFHTLESWGGYFKPFLDGPFIDAPPSVLRAHTPDAARLTRGPAAAEARGALLPLDGKERARGRQGPLDVRVLGRARTAAAPAQALGPSGREARPSVPDAAAGRDRLRLAGLADFCVNAAARFLERPT